MYTSDNNPVFTAAQRAPSPPLQAACAVQQDPVSFSCRNRALLHGAQVIPCHRATLHSLSPELLDMIGSYLTPGELRNLALSSRQIAAKLDTRPYTQALQRHGGPTGSRDRRAGKEYLYPLCNRFSAESPEGFDLKTMWFGWLDGLGQYRAGPVQVLAHGSQYLPFEQLDPVRGVTDSVALPLFISAGPPESEQQRADRVKNEVPHYLHVDTDVLVSYANHSDIWSLRRNSRLHLTKIASLPVPSACCSIDTELNGRTVTATGTANGYIYLYDFTGDRGLFHTFKLHSAKITGLFSVQGGGIVSASQDGVLHMWQPVGNALLASHRLPKKEELKQITQVNDNHFLTRSIEKDQKLWRLWQIGQASFDCIALLGPQLSGSLQSDSRVDQALRDVQLFYQGSAKGRQARMTVLDRRRIICIIYGRDDRSTGQDGPTTLEFYDLNGPQPPSKVTAKWTDPDSDRSITVPVWEPRALPAMLCDDKALLVKSLDDGRLVVVSSTGRVVLYDFDSGKIQELIYRPHSDNETVTGAFLGKDNLVWLRGATGTMSVIDPHAWESGP